MTNAEVASFLNGQLISLLSDLAQLEKKEGFVAAAQQRADEAMTAFETELEKLNEFRKTAPKDALGQAAIKVGERKVAEAAQARAQAFAELQLERTGFKLKAPKRGTIEAIKGQIESVRRQLAPFEREEAMKAEGERLAAARLASEQAEIRKELVAASLEARAQKARDILFGAWKEADRIDNAKRDRALAILQREIDQKRAAKRAKLEAKRTTDALMRIGENDPRLQRLAQAVP